MQAVNCDLKTIRVFASELLRTDCLGQVMLVQVEIGLFIFHKKYGVRNHSCGLIGSNPRSF
jgi:hypothetical protein